MFVYTNPGQNVDGQNVDGQNVDNFGNIGQNVDGQNVDGQKKKTIGYLKENIIVTRISQLIVRYNDKLTVNGPFMLTIAQRKEMHIVKRVRIMYRMNAC